MDHKLSLQSLPDSEVFSSCTLDHQDVYMYEDDHYSRGEADSPTYLDISASKSSHFPSIKQEPDTDTLMSWTQKHPEHWTQSEILDWIYFVAGTIDVDPTTIRGEGFQNISGPELCRMTDEDFLQRDPVNGRLFYDMFRMLFKDAIFYEPQGHDFNPPENVNYPFKTEPTDVRSSCHLTDIKHKPTERPSCNDKEMLVRNNQEEMQVLLGEYWYPIDPLDTGDVITELSNEMWHSHSESGYSSSDADSNSDFSEISKMATTGSRSLSTGSDSYLSDEDYYGTLTSMGDETHKYKQQKSPPRRKKSACHDGDKPGSQNRGRKPGQISKGNHLWEFIRDLLKDPKFNPHLLRWEEKETGVFRFVQSEAVAQMWGRKKNNPGMTYEKLSRAMRFCRTAGYFAEVPKTGKFPKKLCFRFGAKAYGWED